MNTIKLCSDSTSDLSAELIQQNNIAIIPLFVNFSNQSYRDNLDITSATLFRKVSETGTLPSTSAPSPSDFTNEFAKHIEKGMDILHISLSSKISTAYQNACIAAEQFPQGRIKIIDSLNLSSGIGLLVMTAADCIQKGLPLDSITSTVQEKVAKVRTQFIIDTAEYLYKGGRCSGLQMVLSSVLKIHPVIQVTDGSMHLAAKIRGSRQQVLNFLVSHAQEKADEAAPERVFITHTGCDDDALWIKNKLAELNVFQQILITNASCVISSHCGPNTIGILFMDK